MAKEWILNSAVNRFQFNFKRNVGAVSEAIRKCAPRNLDEWRSYYYSSVRSEQHISELGRKLYIKITEVLVSEIEEVTEEDCIEYMKGLVIDRTYDGYTTEIKTIYGQLQGQIHRKIIAAPDKWDRLYNVDFYIEVKGKYIGLQIKPVTNSGQIPEIYKERSLQEETHRKFLNEFGGKVFYIYSAKQGDKKAIVNQDIIPDIINEITRLEDIDSL
jgi:hypothetical protein